MKRIALTGGIGSGKSYVCSMLKKHGIDVYDCDDAAKRIMRTSPAVISALKTLVGSDVYGADGSLNKACMASFILASEENASAVNSIVHPAVGEDFISTGMQWMECAILFESGFDKYVDSVICVTAPENVRTERIMKRDGISREKALQWINCQMSQDEVRSRSDFEIINDGAADVEAQIRNILNIL